MSDIDAKLAELKRATSGLNAPAGFEARVALALVAAPASTAATVLSLKFKALLAFLLGAGVLLGVHLASLDDDAPAVAPASAPTERAAAVSPPSRTKDSFAPTPAAQRMLKADHVEPTVLSPDQPTGTLTAPAATQSSTTPGVDPRLTPAASERLHRALPEAPVAVWPAPGCERTHSTTVLSASMPLAKAQRLFPSTLRTLLDLPHAPIVVGRLAGVGNLTEAFGDEVTVLEHGWFFVQRKALPVWVRVRGSLPMKLEASEGLPTDDSSYVGEVRFRTSPKPASVAFVTVIGDFTTTHATVDIAELPCGAQRTSAPHLTQRFTLAPGRGSTRTVMLDNVSPGPSLATLHGDGLLEERAIFIPSEAFSPLTFTIERLVEFDAEYFIVGSERSRTLGSVSANNPLNLGADSPLELLQRSGSVSFDSSGGWLGVETDETGPLVDVKVAPFRGLARLSGQVKPGQVYLVQHGSTFALLRLSRRP